MKKYLLTSALTITAFFFFNNTFAQGNLAPDQNPLFATSRDKYMKIADSVNQWHRTTFQETYKAFDWYEQKQERRNENRKFRQLLRIERSRYDYGYRPYYNYNYNSYRHNRLRFCWY